MWITGYLDRKKNSMRIGNSDNTFLVECLDAMCENVSEKGC